MVVMTPKDHLTPKEELFAQAVARLGNLARAYREVIDSAPNGNPRRVWENASKLAARPHVARRIDEIRAAALERTTADLMLAVQEAWDIATADPAEISRMWRTACRCCHGQGYAYQWTDAAEYERAVAAAVKSRKDPPNCDGGFGFDAHAEPNLACPECFGKGIEHEWFCDPTQLTGKAAKLYAGLHPKTHRPMCKDQDAAWDRVCRLMGWNRETVKIPERSAPEDVGPMTPERAERAYLALVQGGRVA